MNIIPSPEAAIATAGYVLQAVAIRQLAYAAELRVMPAIAPKLNLKLKLKPRESDDKGRTRALDCLYAALGAMAAEVSYRLVTGESSLGRSFAVSVLLAATSLYMVRVQPGHGLTLKLRRKKAS